MKGSLDKIQGFYNKHAYAYYKEREQKGGRLFNEYIEMPATKRAFPKKIAKGSKILDVGCGIGTYTKYFSDLGAQVTGIDISEKMIEISKKVCKGKGNTQFITGDFLKYDFQGERFDYIVGAFMLSYFHDLPFAFNKIAKLLNPNGIVVLSMLHPVRLSVAKDKKECFCIENYFDENDYATDLGFEEDYIALKKWSFEDVIYTSTKSNLCLQGLYEPRPDIPAGRKIKNSDIYYNCPSVVIFKFKKLQL